MLRLMAPSELWYDVRRRLPAGCVRGRATNVVNSARVSRQGIAEGSEEHEPVDVENTNEACDRCPGLFGNVPAYLYPPPGRRRLLHLSFSVRQVSAPVNRRI